jgi:urease accessory protein
MSITSLLTAPVPQVVAEHAFVGPGWIHPLTGVDHMAAMLAVGAWSAILGGRSIWAVPGTFVLAMGAGAGAGIVGIDPPGVEMMIAVSVLVLGSAITAQSFRRPATGGLSVALFGLCHGVSHGTAYSSAESQLDYVTGILATTACLHLVGAVATLLILDTLHGARTMRLIGALTAISGVAFVMHAA